MIKFREAQIFIKFQSIYSLSSNAIYEQCTHPTAQAIEDDFIQQAVLRKRFRVSLKEKCVNEH